MLHASAPRPREKNKRQQPTPHRLRRTDGGYSPRSAALKHTHPHTHKHTQRTDTTTTYQGKLPRRPADRAAPKPNEIKRRTRQSRTKRGRSALTRFQTVSSLPHRLRKQKSIQPVYAKLQRRTRTIHLHTHPHFASIPELKQIRNTRRQATQTRTDRKNARPSKLAT